MSSSSGPSRAQPGGFIDAAAAFADGRKFTIPKKRPNPATAAAADARRSSGQAELPRGGREWEDSEKAWLRSFHNPQLGRDCTLHAVSGLRNPELDKKLEARRAELRADGYSEAQLGVTHAFLPLLSPSEAEPIRKHGLRVGNAADGDLGHPMQGAHLARHADVLSGAALSEGGGGWVAVFRLLRGKSKAVPPESGLLEPSPGLDSHQREKAAAAGKAPTAPGLLFAQTRIYAYQYRDCELEEYPATVAPLALLRWSYKAGGGGALKADQELWKGSLRLASALTLPDVALLSAFSRMKPFGLEKSLVVKALVPVETALAWRHLAWLRKDGVQGSLHRRRELRVGPGLFASHWRLSSGAQPEAMAGVVRKLAAAKSVGIGSVLGSSTLVVFPHAELASVLGLPSAGPDVDATQLHLLMISYRSATEGLNTSSNRRMDENWDEKPTLNFCIKEAKVASLFRDQHSREAEKLSPQEMEIEDDGAVIIPTEASDAPRPVPIIPTGEPFKDPRTKLKPVNRKAESLASDYSFSRPGQRDPDAMTDLTFSSNTSQAGAFDDDDDIIIEEAPASPSGDGPDLASGGPRVVPLESPEEGRELKRPHPPGLGDHPAKRPTGGIMSALATLRSLRPVPSVSDDEPPLRVVSESSDGPASPPPMDADASGASEPILIPDVGLDELPSASSSQVRPLAIRTHPPPPPPPPPPIQGEEEPAEAKVQGWLDGQADPTDALELPPRIPLERTSPLLAPLEGNAFACWGVEAVESDHPDSPGYAAATRARLRSVDKRLEATEKLIKERKKAHFGRLEVEPLKALQTGSDSIGEWLAEHAAVSKTPTVLPQKRPKPSPKALPVYAQLSLPKETNLPYKVAVEDVPETGPPVADAWKSWKEERRVRQSVEEEAEGLWDEAVEVSEEQQAHQELTEAFFIGGDAAGATGTLGGAHSAQIPATPPSPQHTASPTRARSPSALPARLNQTLPSLSPFKLVPSEAAEAGSAAGAAVLAVQDAIIQELDAIIRLRSPPAVASGPSKARKAEEAELAALKEAVEATLDSVCVDLILNVAGGVSEDELWLPPMAYEDLAAAEKAPSSSLIDFAAGSLSCQFLLALKREMEDSLAGRVEVAQMACQAHLATELAKTAAGCPPQDEDDDDESAETPLSKESKAAVKATLRTVWSEFRAGYESLRGLRPMDDEEMVRVNSTPEDRILATANEALDEWVTALREAAEPVVIEAGDEDYDCELYEDEEAYYEEEEPADNSALSNHLSQLLADFDRFEAPSRLEEEAPLSTTTTPRKGGSDRAGPSAESDAEDLCLTLFSDEEEPPKEEPEEEPLSLGLDEELDYDEEGISVVAAPAEAPPPPTPQPTEDDLFAEMLEAQAAEFEAEEADAVVAAQESVSAIADSSTAEFLAGLDGVLCGMDAREAEMQELLDEQMDMAEEEEAEEAEYAAAMVDDSLATLLRASLQTAAVPFTLALDTIVTKAALGEPRAAVFAPPKPAENAASLAVAEDAVADFERLIDEAEEAACERLADAADEEDAAEMMEAQLPDAEEEQMYADLEDEGEEVEEGEELPSILPEDLEPAHLSRLSRPGLACVSGGFRSKAAGRVALALQDATGPLLSDLKGSMDPFFEDLEDEPEPPSYLVPLFHRSGLRNKAVSSLGRHMVTVFAADARRVLSGFTEAAARRGRKRGVGFDEIHDESLLESSAAAGGPEMMAYKFGTELPEKPRVNLDCLTIYPDEWSGMQERNWVFEERRDGRSQSQSPFLPEPSPTPEDTDARPRRRNPRTGLLIPDEVVLNRATLDDLRRILEAFRLWTERGTASWRFQLHPNVVLKLTRLKTDLDPQTISYRRLSGIIKLLAEFRRGPGPVVQLLSEHECEAAEEAPGAYPACLDGLRDASPHGPDTTTVFLSNAPKDRGLGETLLSRGHMVMGIQEFIDCFIKSVSNAFP